MGGRRFDRLPSIRVRRIHYGSNVRTDRRRLVIGFADTFGEVKSLTRFETPRDDPETDEVSMTGHSRSALAPGRRVTIVEQAIR